MSDGDSEFEGVNTSNVEEMEKWLREIPINTRWKPYTNITDKVRDVAVEGDYIFAILPVVGTIDSSKADMLPNRAAGTYISSNPALIALQDRFCIWIPHEEISNFEILYRNIDYVKIDKRWFSVCDTNIYLENKDWYTLTFSDKGELKHFENWIENSLQKYIKIDKVKLAKQMEENLDYEKALTIYENIDDQESAKRVRKLKSEQGSVKVTQKVVHGDEVTKTEIKDSVLNRSSVGGGSSKAEELREAKSLFEEGLIDDDEFKQMKKEILGK